jgi:hypothetical protein
MGSLLAFEGKTFQVFKTWKVWGGKGTVGYGWINTICHWSATRS